MSDSPTPTTLDAAPFWAAIALFPLVWVGVIMGGWTVFLVSIYGWMLFPLLDRFSGFDLENLDPQTPRPALFWYRLGILVWTPLQVVTLFGGIAVVARGDHLAAWEVFFVISGLGILSGLGGIVYAHELMHKQTRLERWLADVLMAMVQYGHFRTEHMLVHHAHVGTPRDAVTARYNEHFHKFFFRVIWQCLRSAWRAEAARLARKGLPAWDRSNPFWRYATLQLGFIILAVLAGGWIGLGFYLFAALVAVWQLELINYVEHYGLTRKHLGNGRYEPQKPHHSWNAAQFSSNRLLINLQRHSDHHVRPDRDYPLLQNYGPDQAPQLPYGYGVMSTMALIPPLWRRRMNPLVRHWRRTFYPEITDWRPYSAGTTPMPR